MGWSLVSKKPQTCLRRALPIGHNADHYSERARSLLHFDEKANDESARSFICTFQKEEPKSNTGALETSLFRRVCVVFVGSSLCSPYFARVQGNGVMRERERKKVNLVSELRKKDPSYAWGILPDLSRSSGEPESVGVFDEEIIEDEMMGTPE